MPLFSLQPSDLHGEDAKEYVELRRKEELLKLKGRVRARELALARLIVIQNEDKELDAGQGDECVELGNEGAGMGCEVGGFGLGDVGVAYGDVRFSCEDAKVANLAGHGVWEAAWGWDVPNSVVGQPGVDNSTMGRGEIGITCGRAGRQGVV
jgi:hypothetical protein